jgi:GxxExxY protein
MDNRTAGYEETTRRIIGCAMRLHSILGAGLIESVYHRCLHSEMAEDGLQFVSHQRVPVVYKGRHLGPYLFVDFIVGGVVLVEIKAVEHLAPVHAAQVITYLKLTGCPVGLLINFNVPSLRSGIRRLYNRDRRLFTVARTGETGRGEDG